MFNFSNRIIVLTECGQLPQVFFQPCHTKCRFMAIINFNSIFGREEPLVKKITDLHSKIAQQYV